MSSYLDTTKTGNASYKELQEANDTASLSKEDMEALERLSKYQPKRSRSIETFVGNLNFGTPIYVPGYDDFGESKYDPEVIFEHELDNLEHIRATNQSSLDKVANALVKTGVIAGTTFLQGTVGLAAGVADALGNIGNKNESGWETFSRLFHNDVSNTLSEVNDWSEREFANYKTNEEQNNEWWQNLDTVNFWFDNVFKNVVGFAGGAMLAGGGVTSLARTLGAVSTKLGARVVGTLAGAAGESSIVANDALKEFRATEAEKLATEYNNIKNNILSSGLSSGQKAYALNDLDQNMGKRHQEMLETTARNAIFTGAVSMAATSLFDFFSISKIYAANMRVPKSKTGESLFKRADKYASQQEKESFAKRIFKKEDGFYDYKKLTKKEQLLRGLGKGSLEGWEEMTQQFGTSTGAALSSYDSPDSYYEALLDDEAIINTKDLLTSVVEGFGKSYGDFRQWEQFFVGAIGGLIGLPTFGKVQNSDSSTWLGKDKKVGISGGLFGYMKEYSNENKDLENTVNEMNSHLDKVKKQTMHFAQSNAFTNIKEGFSEEDNTFERKNGEDNEDFAVISSYVKAGRLQDYKDLVNQDFENISDEQLGIIARGGSSTKADTNGWKNIDGTYKSDSEEGRKEMRKALSKKRDKILKEIDNYEKSLSLVLNATSGILSEDETNELAWLHWKIDRFGERFKDIVQTYRTSLQKTANDLLNNRDLLTKMVGEDHVLAKNFEKLSLFISYLAGSSNPLEFASVLKNNPKIVDMINNGSLDSALSRNFFNFDDYSNFKEDINDAVKLAILAEQFQNKYDEYLASPNKLKENRQRIQEEKEAEKEIKKQAKKEEDIKNKSAQEIRITINEGILSKEDIANMKDAPQSAIDGAELAELENMVKSISLKEEVDRNTYNAVVEELFSAVDNIGDLNNVDIDQIDLDKIASDKTTPEEIIKDKEAKVVAVFSLVKENINSSIQKKKESDSYPKKTPKKEEIKESKGKDPTEDISNDTIEKYSKQYSSVHLLVNDIVVGYKGPRSYMTVLRTQIEYLLKYIQQERSLGSSYEEIMSKAKPTLDQINSIFPEAVKRIEVYTNSLFAEEDTKDVTENYAPTQEVSLDILENQEKELENNLKEENDQSSSKYNWRTLTTEIGIHNDREDFTPFYIIVKDLVEKGNKSKYYATYKDYLKSRYDEKSNTFKYTPQEIQRMEEVHKHLVDKGAFNRVNSGQLNKGEVVHFVIDSTLNEKAGDVVILITNSRGEIIGDLPNKEIAKYKDPNLISLIESIEEEYNSTEDKTTFMSKYSTSIKEILYGKIPFTFIYNTRTIKEVFGKEKIHLAYADNEGKMQGISRKLKIRKPLNTIKGNAYVLFPGGNGTYIPIPFILSNFDANTKDTKAGQLVYKAIKDIIEGNGNRDSHVKKLSTLLNAGFKFKNNSGRWDVVMIKGKKITSLYKDESPTRTFQLDGTIENNTKDSVENIINTIIDNLFGSVTFKLQSNALGTDFTINGETVSYESIISEVGKVNLPANTTQPLNTWFLLEPNVTQSTPIQESSSTQQIKEKEENNFPNLSKKEQVIWDKIEEDVQKKIQSLGEDKVKAILERLKEHGIGSKSSTGLINSVVNDILEKDEDFKNITRYREAEKTGFTPIKEKYKGKLIFAQAGSGKTSIADNIEVFDGDYLLAQILGVGTPQVKEAMDSLSSKRKIEVSHLYEESIKEKLREGKTVITARLNSLKDADVIIYNSDVEETLNRTSNVARSNVSKDKEYHLSSINTILSHIKDKEHYDLSSGEFLADILLTDPSFNITKYIVNKYNNIESLLEDYLLKFGITIQEIKDSGYSVDLIERTINISSNKQITKAAGELIAYMSMFHPEEKDIIVKMALKEGAVTKDQIYNSNGTINTLQYRNLNKSKYFKIIGNAIAEDLNYQFNYIKKEGKVDIYNTKVEDAGFLQKIRNIIKNFFSKIINYNEDKKLFEYAKRHSINVLNLNEYYIKKSIFKPGDQIAGFVNKVDLNKALQENPYEFSLINKISSIGAALAGSASIATQGSVYRPLENPLHDLDFSIGEKDKKYLDEFLPKVLDNVQHVRTIVNGDNIAVTETYLSFTEPFIIESPESGMSIYKVKHKNTGNIIATFVNNDLTILDSSVKGKFLDFFVNDPIRYPYAQYTYNGHTFSVTNYKSAFYAKLIEYNNRLKDIWDFNRFVPNNINNYRTLYKELQWLEEALPNLGSKERLTIVDNLIDINDNRKAYGMFRNGIITISKQGARGTVYHEAFHAVTHLLLSDSERSKLFNEGHRLYGKELGSVQVEEKLAESFRKFMEGFEDTSIKGRILRWFRKLKHLLKSFIGKEDYLDTIFYKVKEGKFGQREVSYDNTTTKFREEDNLDVEDYREVDLEYEIVAIKDRIKRIKQYYTQKRKEYEAMYDDLWKRYANKYNTFSTLRTVVKNGKKGFEKDRYFLLNNVGDYGDIEKVRASVPEKYRPIVEIARHHEYYRAILSTGYKIKVLQELAEERDNLLKIEEQRLAWAKEDLQEYKDSKDYIYTPLKTSEQIKSYHKSKNKYDNLSPFKKQIIQESGINPEEYKQMSLLEEEVFWKCHL